MKAMVNQEICTGCGLCSQTCPKVFTMEEEKAKVSSDPVPEDATECAKKAKEDCPVDAIKTEE